MNSVNFIGNIGNVPELRQTRSGKSVLNLNIAVDDIVTGGDTGERVKEQRTDWIPVVIWGPLAEHCHRNLSKGHKVAVSGSVRSRVYQNQSGATVHTLEVWARNIDF